VYTHPIRNRLRHSRHLCSSSHEGRHCTAAYTTVAHQVFSADGSLLPQTRRCPTPAPASANPSTILTVIPVCSTRCTYSLFSPHHSCPYTRSNDHEPTLGLQHHPVVVLPQAGRSCLRPSRRTPHSSSHRLLRRGWSSWEAAHPSSGISLYFGDSSSTFISSTSVSSYLPYVVFDRLIGFW
jgi:hypothetical protein